MENRSEYILNIIIPCWNASKYLPELLDSILAQTYKNWQLIAVDDESVDNTVDILKQYSEKDTRITYKIRNRGPKGAQTCRNIGFDSITAAKYVIFMDSDDILAPYCFEQRVRYMNLHDNLDFAVFPAKAFNKTTRDDNSFVIGVDDTQDDIQNILLPVLPFSIWNNIYRVESLRMCNLRWDEGLLSLQDSDFALQSILKDMQYLYANNVRVDYFWRIDNNSGSITTKLKSKEHCFSHIIFFEKIYNSFSNDQRKKYKFAMQFRLLTFFGDIRREQDLIEKFFKLSFVEKNMFYKWKLKVYSLFPLNKKLKHLLFPQLVSLYIKANNLHEEKLSKRTKELLAML